MTVADLPILFDCEDDQLVGVLSLPQSSLDTGVVVVVGGPQYRVGSHRQFVHLARALADAGIPCLRFDYRGMGDSEGSPGSFESIDTDIGCAVSALMARVPAVKQVVLWGLCDGASAALIALCSLPRVAGVIALNPWVRSETSLDQAIVRRYYVQRVLSREFWTKLLAGQLDAGRAVTELMGRLSTAFAHSREPNPAAQEPTASMSFRDRMREGLVKFDGPVLIVLSGRDLTAQEYEDFAASDSRWKRALARNPRVITQRLAEADHTFSSEKMRAEVERLSSRFVLSLCKPDSSAP